MEAGKTSIIINQEGDRTTPSVVSLSDGSVGISAKRAGVVHPESTIYSVKRLIGRRYKDIKGELKNLSYSVFENSNGSTKIVYDDNEHSPQEISSKILIKLKKAAEDYLGEKVEKAVITVPAYFDDSQRMATKVAGEIAGLDVVRIINEPTAAALAYGVDKKDDFKVMVVDIGGGTTDFSVLEVGGGIVEVLSTSGDTYLGGDDIDNVLLGHFIEEFKNQTNIDASGDKMVMQRLKEAAEKAKIELSLMLETEVNLPFLSANETGPKHFIYKLSRSKFEVMIMPLLERALVPCKIALEDAKLSVDDIDEVLFVGGTTRIPLVTKIMVDFFGKEPNKSVNPDEIVAMGAAIQGAVLSGDDAVKDILLLDVTPLSLGIETLGGVFTRIIERNTTIPCVKSEIFSTAANNQPAVSIVAYQGERNIAANNKLLGKFDLIGIPPAPKGTPQIEVKFNLNSDGILNVVATDKVTGENKDITITSSCGLSDEEIEKMKNDAEENKVKDEEKIEIINLRNELETLKISAESLFKEHSGKAYVNPLGDVIKSTEELLGNSDTTSEALNEQKKMLESILHNISKEMYQGCSDDDLSCDARGENSKRGEVIIDAEFEDIE
jgi:molecular chaperone DnaK